VTTDENGCFYLGALDEVKFIDVYATELGTSFKWDLKNYYNCTSLDVHLPDTYDVVKGQAIGIPSFGLAGQISEKFLLTKVYEENQYNCHVLQDCTEEF
jgi:hypothetical protein